MKQLLSIDEVIAADPESCLGKVYTTEDAIDLLKKTISFETPGGYARLFEVIHDNKRYLVLDMVSPTFQTDNAFFYELIEWSHKHQYADILLNTNDATFISWLFTPERMNWYAFEDAIATQTLEDAIFYGRIQCTWVNELPIIRQKRGQNRTYEANYLSLYSIFS